MLGAIVKHDELLEAPKPRTMLKVQYPVRISVPGQPKALEYDDLDEVVAR